MGSQRLLRIAQRDRPPAGGRHLPELSTGEEADPLAVRREERPEEVVLGAGDEAGFGLREGTQVDAPRRVVGEPPAVGRERDDRPVGVAEVLAFGKLDVEARDRPGVRRSRRAGDPGDGARDEGGARGQRDRASPRRASGSRGRGGHAAFGKDPFELKRGVAGGLPASRGILGEARPDEMVERGRRHRPQLRDGRGLPLQDRGDDAGRRPALERLPAGDHLVDHGAEREDVGARVGLFAVELFRRHVLQGAEDRASAGQPSGRRRAGGSGGNGRRRAQLGEAEVEDVRPSLREHHVARLQVPVHDAPAVRLVEGVGDLDRVPERPVQRHRAPGQPLLQRLALQVLHHQVVDAVVLPDVEDRTDVRVAQGGQRLRFALEPLLQRGIARGAGPQDLDRHGPVEARVVRAIDLAHAAGFDQRLDSVGTEHAPRLDPRPLVRRREDVVAEPPRVLVRREQGVHLRAQRSVAGAGLLEERVAGRRLPPQRGMEDGRDLAPAVRRHRPPWRAS